MLLAHSKRLLNVGDLRIHKDDFHVLVDEDLLRFKIDNLIRITRDFFTSSVLIPSFIVLLSTADAVAGAVITPSIVFLTSSGVIVSSLGSFTIAMLEAPAQAIDRCIGDVQI